MVLRLSEENEKEKKIEEQYELIKDLNPTLFTLDEILFLSQAWQVRNRTVVLKRLTDIAGRVRGVQEWRQNAER